MRLIAFAAAVLIASPSLAAAPGWIVDKKASKVGFSAMMSGQPFSGSFGRWDARIQFDPKSLTTSSVNVVIETGSAATGDQSRDEAMPTADWFSVSAFPRATYQAKAFKDLGGGRYLAAGVLRIRNVARPVILPFQLVIDGNKATMRGSLNVDRRVFGVGQGQFVTGDMISTNVRIDVMISAKRGK
jgi:polyisoprenoid-binding protein YceI